MYTELRVFSTSTPRARRVGRSMSTVTRLSACLAISLLAIADHRAWPLAISTNAFVAELRILHVQRDHLGAPAKPSMTMARIPPALR